MLTLIFLPSGKSSLARLFMLAVGAELIPWQFCHIRITHDGTMTIHRHERARAAAISRSSPGTGRRNCRGAFRPPDLGGSYGLCVLAWVPQDNGGSGPRRAGVDAVRAAGRLELVKGVLLPGPGAGQALRVHAWSVVVHLDLGVLGRRAGGEPGLVAVAVVGRVVEQFAGRLGHQQRGDSGRLAAHRGQVYL